MCGMNHPSSVWRKETASGNNAAKSARRTRCEGLRGNTFHGYNPPACTLIDYVFVKGKAKVLSHATLDDMPGGKLPTDHFPVAVTVEL